MGSQASVIVMTSQSVTSVLEHLRNKEFHSSWFFHLSLYLSSFSPKCVLICQPRNTSKSINEQEGVFLVKISEISLAFCGTLNFTKLLHDKGLLNCKGVYLYYERSSDFKEFEHSFCIKVFALKGCSL